MDALFEVEEPRETSDDRGEFSGLRLGGRSVAVLVPVEPLFVLREDLPASGLRLEVEPAVVVARPSVETLPDRSVALNAERRRRDLLDGTQRSTFCQRRSRARRSSSVASGVGVLVEPFSDTGSGDADDEEGSDEGVEGSEEFKGGQHLDPAPEGHQDQHHEQHDEEYANEGHRIATLRPDLACGQAKSPPQGSPQPVQDRDARDKCGSDGSSGSRSKGSRESPALRACAPRR